MSFTCARPMLASAVHQLHQSAARSFSTAPVVCSKVLSPLNKTSLARQQRANKGLVKGGKRGKGKQTMTLEEASRVLAAWSPATPNAAYEINVTTKTSGTIQLNALRGRVFLPHSCASATKQSTLVVFASGQAAQAAREAGADVVGGQELIDDILAGNVNPDKLITTTEMFALFQRNPTLARTLGPRGLMPSAKRGTVTDDIVQAVKEARGGLDWKGDNKGIVRAAIGRLHFQPEQLADNVHTLLASVADIAQGGNGSVNGVPPHVKRPAITRVLISSTQGPGIELSDA